MESEVIDLVRHWLGKYVTGIWIPVGLYLGENSCSIFSNLEEGFEIKSTDEVEVKFGTTKLILIPKNKSYVIKITISGTCDLDCESGWYIVQENLASNDILSYENYLYNKMSKDLQKIVLPNHYIGEFNGLRIYIQDKF